jgi:hypothetical protein
LKKRKELPPAFLAWCMATSAYFSNAPMLYFRLAKIVTPMLGVLSWEWRTKLYYGRFEQLAPPPWWTFVDLAYFNSIVNESIIATDLLARRLPAIPSFDHCIVLGS